MKPAILTLSGVLLSLSALSTVQAAFVVEADNAAPEGKAFDHFVSTPPGTGFQLSATPSTAVGLSGNQSAFGNPANMTGPDRYELFYTPGPDIDNTGFLPGTPLGNSSASDSDGAGPLPPSYAISPLTATGAPGGLSGLYNVYFTVPSTANVNALGSTITINSDGAPIVLNPVVMNNGGTGPDETVGAPYTGGANNRWLKLGAVSLTAGNTYSVVIEANANPPDAVSQRTHGVMWEFVSAIQPPPTGGLGLYGVQPATGTIVRVNPGTGATSPIASPAGLNAIDTLTGLSGAEGGSVLIYENDQDGSSNDIQRYDPLTGALLSNHANDNWTTDGLTYHNGNIFYSHTLGDVHRQAGYGGPESFGFTPSSPVGGLGGDDLSRAFQNSTDGLIREFSPVTGAIVNSFPAPVGGVQGLAFDGNFLYASTATGSLFTLDPNSGAVLNSVIVAGGPLYALGVANSIPEPATTGLLAIGSLAVFLAARRRVSA